MSAMDTSPDPIPFSTRAHWMRRANEALTELLLTPCPQYAFGTSIVNHTGHDGLGELICIGANDNGREGNPTLHGEIAAIRNCTKVLTDPEGPYKLTGGEAIAAFQDLTLYTNGEPCPMCASAIRWSGFKECAWATSIEFLIAHGWHQIHISSFDVFEAAHALPNPTARLIPHVLHNETDPLFAWQYRPQTACPKGCSRADSDGACASV